jgi:hypothetical protein
MVHASYRVGKAHSKTSCRGGLCLWCSFLLLGFEQLTAGMLRTRWHPARTFRLFAVMFLMFLHCVAQQVRCAVQTALPFKTQPNRLCVPATAQAGQRMHQRAQGASKLENPVQYSNA